MTKTLKTQEAKSLAGKGKSEALHNEQRRNFEWSSDFLHEASAAGCLEAVQAQIAVPELVGEGTAMQGPRQMSEVQPPGGPDHQCSSLPAQPLRNPGGLELLQRGPTGRPRSRCQKDQRCRCHMGG
ncbi:hypothetical protein MRX96_017496 [Rhipicephalus microplus]